MAALAITPASGSITAKKTVCRVDLTGADANTLTGYDGTVGYAGQPTQYPASPELRYYITFELGGSELGRSYVFGPDGGAHTFNNYIFPEAGSWTVRLNNAADDSSVTTLAVTVS